MQYSKSATQRLHDLVAGTQSLAIHTQYPSGAGTAMVIDTRLGMQVNRVFRNQYAAQLAVIDGYRPQALGARVAAPALGAA